VMGRAGRYGSAGAQSAVPTGQVANVAAPMAGTDLANVQLANLSPDVPGASTTDVPPQPMAGSGMPPSQQVQDARQLPPRGDAQLAQAGGSRFSDAMGSGTPQGPAQGAMPPGVEVYDQAMRHAAYLAELAKRTGDADAYRHAMSDYTKAAQAKQGALQSWRRAEIDQPTEVVDQNGVPVITPRRQAYGLPAFSQSQGARNDLVGPDGRINQPVLQAREAISRLQGTAGVENAERKAFGEQMGKMAADAVTAGNKAGQRMAQLETLETLLNNLETDKLAPTMQSVAAWSMALGVDPKAIGLDGRQAVNAEAANAIIGRLMVESIGGGEFPANNFSDADRKFLLTTLPSIANTPEGNRIIIASLREVASRSRQHQQEWLQAQKEGKSYSDFLADWAKRVDATPLIPRPKTPDEARGLRPGSLFVDPNGQLRQVPR
jgi:hypothetical protein